MSLGRLKELSSSIRWRKGGTLWRANPDDPYLYVSFSTKQFLAANGEEEFLYDDEFIESTGLDQDQIDDFDKRIERSFKKVIQHEWIDKAGLPIKFLAEDEPVKNLRRKNICFVIRHKRPLLETLVDGEVRYITIPIQFGMEENNYKIKHSDHKVILFPNISVENFSNQEIYHFLHEAGHAFAEFKHFKKYGKIDYPPFTVMDCTDSVMAYKVDCFKVMLLEYIVLNSLSDSDIQTKFKMINAAYPTTLGKVDLIAAQEFKKSWDLRNENAAIMNKQKYKFTKKYLSNMPAKTELAKIELFRQVPSLGLGKYFDDFVSTLSECKSYFNPQFSYYSTNNTNLLFKSQHSAAIVPQLECGTIKSLSF